MSPDDPESNYAALRRDLLDLLPSAPAWVDRIQGERGPDEAARLYDRGLHRRLERDGRVDIVVLGVGADGHTASLFPTTPASPPGTWAVATEAPSPPRDRVSVTPALLDGARSIVLLAAGEAKAEVVARLAGGEDLPAARIGGERLVWILDRAAARGLPAGFGGRTVAGR